MKYRDEYAYKWAEGLAQDSNSAYRAAVDYAEAERGMLSAQITDEDRADWYRAMASYLSNIADTLVGL